MVTYAHPNAKLMECQFRTDFIIPYLPIEGIVCYPGTYDTTIQVYKKLDRTNLKNKDYTDYYGERCVLFWVDNCSPHEACLDLYNRASSIVETYFLYSTVYIDEEGYIYKKIEEEKFILLAGQDKAHPVKPPKKAFLDFMKGSTYNRCNDPFKGPLEPLNLTIREE